MIVPEIKIGISIFFCSSNSLIAKRAALQLSVSNTVSTKNRSTAPSISPATCSIYDYFNWSKLILRYPGLLTSGLKDAVRFVGPIAPATNLGLSV